MYLVIVLPRAQSALESIAFYLADFSQETAFNFLNAYEEKIEVIKKTPLIYPAFYLNRRYRRFLIGKYAVMYEVIEKNKTIEIAYIKHGSQNMPEPER